MPARLDPHRLKQRLRETALAQGFTAVGFTTPERVPDLGAALSDHIAAGHHGEMSWLAATAHRRRHPSALWPSARGIIVVGASYAPDVDPLRLLEDRSRGVVSVYAARRDYHEVMKGRLKHVADQITALAGGDARVFVDSSPLMEKPLAMAAGLGWQGKHTVLISREAGNWLFLGVLLTDVALPPDEPGQDLCGSCRRCLDICPTAALPAPGQIDSRRCIAYLTVEHEGPIARDLRPLMGNRVFGCDDCLAVCPWNKFAAGSRDARLALREDLLTAPLGELAVLDEKGFRSRFAGTPVRRTGRERFVRNVMIAIGNSGTPALAEAARARLTDPAALVRGAAVWALSRLLDADAFAALAAEHVPGESDPMVREEWRAGAGGAEP